ncbi:MAG: Fe-S cluster assembly ATPase SufC [Deltaproteobacteria bacterium TMED126]|jgi:Fe-S cluster assembly ATP-binding protein|nr:Fe-S cluster assembly ATPase SufC [Candidatus Dadabacteria bacterium]NSW97867.1 Fe-S cluster assembly ATPase SufC [Deltaproteobacteria bacterium TMED126]|tara:strand:- start:1881 stop:2621 length:741 start_codon:yes stop_codon:yes gene_type:complete
MLEIVNLHAKIEDKEILKGLSLKINKGEVHSIMGPNGSGKSTLASILAGKEDYEIIEGDIILNGESILEMSPEERAQEGVFLAFQYPIEIPGVSNSYFLREALNSIRKSKGQDPLKPVEFIKIAKEKIKDLKMKESLLNRSLNEGFSGGEKKRNEILQMSILDPMMAILDETDSGLDIDALQIVADGVNALKNDEKSFLVITHYQRLLNYIVPDYVHVLVDGRIVKSGDKSLALELESKGYSWLEG